MKLTPRTPSRGLAACCLAVLLLAAAPATVSARDALFCDDSSDCLPGYYCYFSVCIPHMTSVAAKVNMAVNMKFGDVPGKVALALKKDLVDRLNRTDLFTVHDINKDSNILDYDYLLYYKIAYIIEITYKSSELISVRTLDSVYQENQTGLEFLIPAGPAGYDPVAFNAMVNRLFFFFTGLPGSAGTRLAFAKKSAWGVKEIFSMDPENGQEEQLTKDGKLALLPSWRPDGRIVYTSFKSGEAWLYLQGRKEPFCNASSMVTGAAWSADGRFAATTMVTDGNSDIWLIDAQTGKPVKRLTEDPGIDTSATWSHDRRELAFVSDRTGCPQIWVMGSNGENVRRVTFTGCYNTSPAWHPLAPYIVYVSRQGGFHLFLLNLETLEAEQITFPPGQQEDPTWSPDGRYIVFVQARGKKRDLFLMNVAKRCKIQLNMTNDLYYNPSWQIFLGKPGRKDAP